jgi:hypothetical protein
MAYGFKPHKETPEETTARLAILCHQLVERGMDPARAERATSNAKPVFDRETGNDVWPQRLARKSVKKENKC